MQRKDYSKIDIKGQKFGRLTALKKVDGTKSQWLFMCDCGKEIQLSYSRLLSGQLSCGCLAKEQRKEFARTLKTHGDSNTKLYRKYKSMLQRCYNPKSKNYKRYGGRGIIVCDEWKNSYIAFKNWALSTGYDPTKDGRKEQSIDRIDNNGNYCPENCKWSTALEQQKNRDITKLYPYKDKMYSASEFADIFNISNKSFVYRRLDKQQSLDFILEEWFKIHNVPNDLIEVKDFAKAHNVHEGTVKRWIRQGKLNGKKIGRKWFVEKASERRANDG